MKTRFITKMIAAMCAAVMTTSCVVSSVGAVKDGYGITQEQANTVSTFHTVIEESIKELDKISDEVRKIDGYEEDTDKLLSELKGIRKLLRSTRDLELCGSNMIERTGRILGASVIPTIEATHKAFLHYDINEDDIPSLLEEPCSNYPYLEHNVRRLINELQLSDELSKKSHELNEAGCLIDKINDGSEKQKLEALYKEADQAFKENISIIDSKNSKPKEKLFRLADKAISEIKKANKAQQEKRKKEEAKKAIDEKRKKEAEERKKQKEKLTERKQVLKQQKRNLEEESKEWNQKAQSLGKLRLIYDEWYSKEELSILQPLMVVDYKLQKISSELQKIDSELQYMDVPKNVGNIANMFNVNHEFNNMDEEKKLIFKKFEINRRLLYLEDELKTMQYFIKHKIDYPGIKEVQDNFAAAKKEMEEINKKIKKEFERRNKARSDFMAGFKVIGK